MGTKKDARRAAPAIICLMAPTLGSPELSGGNPLFFRNNAFHDYQCLSLRVDKDIQRPGTKQNFSELNSLLPASFFSPHSPMFGNLLPMEKEEISIGDLILKRMPYDQAVTLHGGLWYDLLRNYSTTDNVLLNKMHEAIQNDDCRKVVAFLCEQGYIVTVNHSIPNHKITKRGKAASDMGGHKVFSAWEKEQEMLVVIQQQKTLKEQRKINWPQKY